MLRSVWANTYLNVWFDTYTEGQIPNEGTLVRLPELHFLTLALGLLGLVPTLLALLGARISLRRVLGRGDAVIDLGMWMLAAGTLASYVFFAVRIPTWAALKASYLLNLSLPSRGSWYGGRGGSGRRARRSAPSPRWPSARWRSPARSPSPPASCCGDTRTACRWRRSARTSATTRTRRLFHTDSPQASYIDARAAVELLDGRPGTARRYYQKNQPDDPAASPYHSNRLAVAHALDFQLPAARRLLDAALEAGALEELLVNRAALRAVQGDLPGAEQDLRAASRARPPCRPRGRTWPSCWSDVDATPRPRARASGRARSRESRHAASRTRGRRLPLRVGRRAALAARPCCRARTALDCACRSSDPSARATGAERAAPPRRPATPPPGAPRCLLPRPAPD